MPTNQFLPTSFFHLSQDAHVLQLLLWQLYHIQQKLQASRTGIDEQNARIPALRRDHSAEERNVESARKDAASALRDVSKAERDVQKRAKEIEEKQPSLDALEERSAHSRRRIAGAERIIQEIERDVARSRADLAKLERDYENTSQAAQRAEDAERARGSGLSLSENDLDEYHELKAQASALRASERQQLEALRRQLRAQETTIHSLTTRAAQLERSRDKLDDERSLAAEQKDALEATRVETQIKLEDARKGLNELEKQRTRIGQRETELNDILQECYTKLIQAGNDARESEREAKMKESIVALTKIFPGVRGRLVDLCKPTQRKYDLAISTVLGRNADAIIVDQEKTAIDCIEYFRNQRIGQGTFLPLDTIQAKPINDRLRSISRGARLAIDVIQFDPILESAMQYVCGNALVCDNLEVARHLSYQQKVEAKTVALDGTIIHKSGLITGGQGGERARRWEEREVQGLQRQKSECLEELKSLALDRRRLPSAESLSGQISEAESRLTMLRDDLGAANSRHAGLVTELSNARRQLEDTAPRIEAANTEAESIRQQASSLSSTVDGADDEVFAAFCSRIGVANIREYEERQLALLERQKDARLEFETQMKRLDHQINFTKSQLTGQEERLSTNRRLIEKEQARLTGFATSQAELQASIDEIKVDVERRNHRLEQLREEHERRAAELSETKRTLSKASKALDAAHKEISNFNDQIEKLASQRGDILRRCRLEEIELPLVKGSLSKVSLQDVGDDGVAPMDVDDDVTQRAISITDYGIEPDFSDLDPSLMKDDSSSTEAELRERIDKITEVIDKLAPNMKAASRVEDTEARHKDSETEFERARKEAAAAKTAFNDIKKRRCDLFNKAFNHISSRIDDVYKDLTKGKAAPMGGVAYLSLEDSEEPYLSGIRYNAMPPMKPFRDMELLSGGEKTMAALALLFCIATFAPPPFFVLDEVDAALDSQNVAKVAAYIRRRARPDFQFIVISLKASLYERAEGLVGVYRKTEDNQNSSASLTLDLEQYE